jgi:hypothetical protein
MTNASGLHDLPKTWDSVRAQGAPPTCRSCGKEPATATINLTAADRITGKSVYQIRKIPVCEACGATVAAMMKRALRI